MIGTSRFRKTPVAAEIEAALGDRYDREQLATIDRFSTTIDLPAGEVFVTEGQVGQEVILILDGTAVVCRNGETIASVGAGDLVGERAVLRNQPRNASLIATTALTIAVFSAREFHSVLAAAPSLAADVAALEAARS
ncbi:MAG: cyclic nucleotide-binding domain-containing protein [Actinomycetota bacterium]